MRLVKIQNALIKMDVKFEYKEDDGAVTFLDDKGDNHVVKEGFNSGLTLDGDYYNNQKQVCEWISENKLLLTDYEKLKELKNAREQERKEEEYNREIIKNINFEKGIYLLEILINRLGEVQYYFNKTKNAKFYEPTLSLKGVSSYRDENLEVTIRAISTAHMNVEETLQYIENMKELVEIAKYFNEVLKPYNDSEDKFKVSLESLL